MRYACGIISIILISGISGIAPALAQSSQQSASGSASTVGNGLDSLAARGKYLAIAADCTSCHTTNKGKAYAGGVAIKLPMGTIIAPNITPSKKYGIGNWSRQDFAASLRQGVSKNGRHLTPTMPYTAYTKLTDADVKALYAYFMHGVKPVNAAPKRHSQLDFPFSLPGVMASWQLLFFNEKRFQPNPKLTDEQNRGAYLAILEHCSTCHTPRNTFMAEDTSKLFAGGRAEGWDAPNITSDKISGVGGWSDDELLSYLKNGHAAGKAQAGGPMATAVTHSLRHLKDQDLRAIIAWLRTVPAIRNKGQSKPNWGVDKPKALNWSVVESPIPPNDDPERWNLAVTNGAILYNADCAACHGLNGQGHDDKSVPPLTNNAAVGSASSTNLVLAIVHGIDRRGADGFVRMSGFGEKSTKINSALTNAQIAAVANYVNQQFGRDNANLTADQVAGIRLGGSNSWLVHYAALIFWVVVAVVVIILLFVATLFLRPRHG